MSVIQIMAIWAVYIFHLNTQIINNNNNKCHSPKIWWSSCPDQSQQQVDPSLIFYKKFPVVMLK